MGIMIMIITMNGLKNNKIGVIKMFKNMNSGYNGYSMSNRAVEAYEDGEKPLSKWRKAEIIDKVKELDIKFNIELLKKVKLNILKDFLLKKSSWHHTSSYCNSTDFYSLDVDYIEELTSRDIEKLILRGKKEKAVRQEEEPKRLANFYYLEWGGSRKHPRAYEHKLEGVYVQKKGCFYHVFDKDGDFILKKKIGSNGTEVDYVEI